jgi:dihydrodipicolinate synthase/N-acetylneuraminate lyase
VVAKRGVPIGPDVRRPLRTLTDTERVELETWLESSSPVPAP